MGPGVLVSGLTAGAMAVVVLLAVQADGAESRAEAARVEAGLPAEPSPSAVAPAPSAPELPASSGTGYRVVYSVSRHRVWLVDPRKTPQLQASFAVTPGSTEPTPGNYSVYSRTATGKGTDGRQIEHVVRFTQQSGVVFGFGAAADGSTAPPDASLRTGGIRSSRADGQVLWDFAPTGTRVVVAE
ncbi:L,D-transpeptidase [Kitasatospora sp. NPDC085879]|uniref:L,D-transpeptidase n=1 Tax=Kitasatospora sp. NPDC085879 TaxID=3154769 RepID=UPI00342DCE04